MPNVNGDKLSYLAIHCREELLGCGKDPTAEGMAVGMSKKTIQNWTNSKKATIAVATKTYLKLGKVLHALSGGEWPDASVLELDSSLDLQQFKAKVQEFVRRAPTGQATIAPLQPAPEPTPEPTPKVLPLTETNSSPDLLHRYCEKSLHELRNPIPGTSIADLRLGHYLWRRISWERRGKSSKEYVRVPIPGDGRQATITLIGDVLKKGRIVLHDDAGMGKTAFTHKCFELLLEPTGWSERWDKRFANAPPLVVRLEGIWPRRTSSNEASVASDHRSDLADLRTTAQVGIPMSVREMLIAAVERRLGPPNPPKSDIEAVVDAALRERRVVVFLDAFDQMTMADREHVSLLLAERKHQTEEGNREVASCAWFITGRAYAINPFESKFLQRVERLRLEPFDSSEQDKYFEDIAKKPFFKKLGKKPLDWICRPRKNVAEDLGLPLNLREIRRLLEIIVDDHATPRRQDLPSFRFRSSGELHAHVAEVLLKRGLKNVKDRRDLAKAAAPQSEPLKESDQLHLLMHVCSLIALQMMLERRWNAYVKEIDPDFDPDLDSDPEPVVTSGENAVAAFLQRAKARFLANSSTNSKVDNSSEHRWDWAVGVLEEIEYAYRGHLDAFNRECRSFRDKKAMEWYAAFYLMNHATKMDMYEAVPGAGARCVRDFAFSKEWLDNCWKQAIKMPGKHIHSASAYRSLEVLLSRRREADGDQRRPCEHIFRLWERWLEPTSENNKRLPNAQRLIDTFRAEFTELVRDGNTDAREIIRGFLPIPAGEFRMGSPTKEKGRYDNETAHEVRLTREYFLHRFPVTNAQYELFDASHRSIRTNTSQGPQQPVVNVSWYEAWCFSRWVRTKDWPCCLPTEAQWERACRGGKDTTYWFGYHPEKLRDHAWFDANSERRTHTLAESKAENGHANQCGLIDMHGNVWEWCHDWYAADYGGMQGIVVDPTGARTGPYRAVRGGSWGDSARECRSALRSRVSPGRRSDGLGFRLALVPSRGLSSSQQAAGVEGQQTAGPEAREGHGGGAARPKAGQKVNASERKKVAKPSGGGP